MGQAFQTPCHTSPNSHFWPLLQYQYEIVAERTSPCSRQALLGLAGIKPVTNSFCADQSTTHLLPHSRVRARLTGVRKLTALAGSDMSVLTFHVGADFGPQRLVSYQVHREAQKVLDVELHTEVRLRGSRTVEADKNVHVASVRSLIPGIGAKQSESSHTESLRECLLVGLELVEDFSSVHLYLLPWISPL